MNNQQNLFLRSKIKFSLKNVTKPFSLIRLRAHIGGKRLVYYLPSEHKIKPAYFDVKTGYAIENLKRNSALKGNATLQITMRNINAEIDKTANALLRIIESYKMQNVNPTSEQVKADLRKELKRDEVQQRPAFKDMISFIDHYVELCRTGVILNDKGVKLKAGSIRSIISTQSALKRYCSRRRIRLTFEKIDIEFYNDFVNFLTEATHSRGRYKPNVIGKFIKGIKALLRYAHENGYTNNDAYKRREFKVLKENVETVYLTEEELGRLKMLDLPGNRAQIRDSFLVSCYTGLRYSDISRLESKHVNYSTNMISIITQKTNTQVIIPIHPIVCEIFERYDKCPPKVQCNQATNRMLKVLCRKAGITDLITIMETRGGVREEKSYAKCDMVTTHTARRSFATNAFKRGVPTLSIMQITGHRTESSFMRSFQLQT
jgi:integrase